MLPQMVWRPGGRVLIGFGKRLAGFRRGDTDYRISALRSADT